MKRNGVALIFFLYFTKTGAGRERCKICTQKFKSQPQNGEHLSNTSLRRNHIEPNSLRSYAY